MNLHNKYELELIDAETLEVKQKVTTHNIVLNKWKDSIAELGTGYQRYITLGRGTGVPAATDTAMFTPLIDYTGLSQVSFTKALPITTWVGTRTFAPTEAIGTITEMGLFYQGGGWSPYTCLMSHAMLKDSEGNNISIVKTATDILKVTVTTYFTFSINHPDEGVNTFMCPGMANRVYRSHTENTPYPDNTDWVYYNNGGWEGRSTRGPDMYLQPHLATAYEFQSGIYADQPRSATSTVDASHKGIIQLAGIPTVAYTYGNTWNNSMGMEIKSIHIDTVGTFNVTPLMFPQQPFGKYLLGVGDDINVNFDLKVPSAVAGTQQVFVDNVLKTAGVDYTFTPKNTKDAYQNWHSADRRKATYKKLYELYVGLNTTVGPFYPRIWEKDICITAEQPIVYDFGAPVMVNQVYVSTMLKTDYSTKYANGRWADNVDLEYSTDGVAWTKFTTITTAMCIGAIANFTPVTARYWRYIANKAIPTSTVNGTSFNALFISDIPTQATLAAEPAILFGGYVPSVVFTTPPALNAVVEISHDIQYPVKNALHEMNLSFTVEIQVS